MSDSRPRLSLGPVLYYWSRDTLLDFYRHIAATPVDIVYLGETVCSKRRTLRGADWLELAQMLESSGKQVVLSSMTLLEAGAELGALQRLCENGHFMVEANDLAAVHSLAGKHPFVTGPAVNIYNGQTLKLFTRLGLRRWVLPVELSGATLQAIHQDRPAGVETEVFAYGRLPLAYSARCFTARAHNLPKDECELRCLDYPDGLLLETRDREPFLVLNGIQTQSAKTCNLLGSLDELRALDVDVLRISPQSRDTTQIIRIFHAAINGQCRADEAEARLQKIMPLAGCNGYWHGVAGMQNCRTGDSACTN